MENAKNVEQTARTKAICKIRTIGEVQSSFSRPLRKHGFWEGTGRVNNVNEWLEKRYPIRQEFYTGIAYTEGTLS